MNASYTTASNARRAANKAGIAAFTIKANQGGTFTVVDAAAQEAAMRQTIGVVDDGSGATIQGDGVDAPSVDEVPTVEVAATDDHAPLGSPLAAKHARRTAKVESAATIKAVVKAAKAAQAKAPAQPAKPAKAAKPLGQRAQAEAAADAGTLPAAPDFSAATHAPYRKRLAAITAAIEAGDIAALMAIENKLVSTSPKALERYRTLAVRALQAKA